MSHHVNRCPPDRVVVTGSRLVWSEAEWHGRAREDRDHGPGCDCGCVRPVAVYRLAGVYAVPLPAWRPQTRHQAGRVDCPNGCGARDLDRERRRGMDRVCLRCLCHTRDADGPPTAYALMKARHAKLARDVERAAKATARKKGDGARRRRAKAG